eukprot:scaffold50608_cov37-Phaeocystis_antarctica.AAC.1
MDDIRVQWRGMVSARVGPWQARVGWDGRGTDNRTFRRTLKNTETVCYRVKTLGHSATNAGCIGIIASGCYGTPCPTGCYRVPCWVARAAVSPAATLLCTLRYRTITPARAELELGLGLGRLNLVAATVDAERTCRAAAHDESRNDDHRLHRVAALLGLEGAQRLEIGQLPRPQRAVAAAAVAHGRRRSNGQHRPLVLERMRAERPVLPPERSKAARSATLGRLQRAAAAPLWHPSGGGSPLGPRRGP